MLSRFRQMKDRIVAGLFLKYPGLLNHWLRNSQFIEFHGSPWTALSKPVSESRLALVTTGGVHLKNQASFDMTDPNGDCSFREIPQDVPASELMITHNYYDHRDADQDINIVFPVDRVRELADCGEIGDISPRHFSFMGHLLHEKVDGLIHQTAPRVADLLKADGVDIVLLTPS